MFSKQIRISKPVVGVLAVSLAAALVAAPSASAAKKSYKVKMALFGPIDSKTGKVKGNTSGKPLGKCTLTGKLVLPNAFFVLKCKGGTVKLTATSKSEALNDVKGTWKVTGGTGKFKGAKGKGTHSGKFSTSKFVYLGNVKY